MTRLIVVSVAMACFFSTGCKQEPKAQPSANTNASSGNPLTAPADYIGAALKAKKSAEKTTSAVGIDQAVKTFFAENGRLPKDLDEMKAKGVSVPNPPEGMKWSYDPNSGIAKAVPQ
jgi:hypothetical protein